MRKGRLLFRPFVAVLYMDVRPSGQQGRDSGEYLVGCIG